jgi:hypothetical protein
LLFATLFGFIGYRVFVSPTEVPFEEREVSDSERKRLEVDCSDFQSAPHAISRGQIYTRHHNIEDLRKRYDEAVAAGKRLRDGRTYPIKEVIRYCDADCADVDAKLATRP